MFARQLDVHNTSNSLQTYELGVNNPLFKGVNNPKMYPFPCNYDGVCSFNTLKSMQKYHKTKNPNGV